MLRGILRRQPWLSRLGQTVGKKLTQGKKMMRFGKPFRATVQKRVRQGAAPRTKPRKRKKGKWS